MEIDADAKLNLPEWTEYRKKNGLDPLGMQNGLRPAISSVFG